MTAVLRAGVLAWVVGCAANGFAAPASNVFADVPIAGGTAALAKAIGLDATPDRPRFLTEVVRVVYESPQGKNIAVTAKQKRLTAHLEAVGQFQRTLAAVQSGEAGVTLAMADRKDERNRLRDFLEFAGLKLKETNKTFTVEPSGSKEAIDRVGQLSAFGIELGSLAVQLNAGKRVRIQVPSEMVPVPLDAKTWSTAIFRRTVPADELFAAIASDARAALLAHGLSAVDDETLGYLAGNPELLTRLYRITRPPWPLLATPSASMRAASFRRAAPKAFASGKRCSGSRFPDPTGLCARSSARPTGASRPCTKP